MPSSASLACASGAMSHPFLGVQKMVKQENYKLYVKPGAWKRLLERNNGKVQ